MTGAEFSEVDIDLLADYVGGALDGTPDEAVVSALIADDPEWRAAHEDLTGGMATVTDGLRSLAAEPMPTDIVVRLTAALADLPPLTRPAAASAGAASSSAVDSRAAEPGAVEPGVPGPGVPRPGVLEAGVSGTGRSEPGSAGSDDGARRVDQPTVAPPGSGGRRVTAVDDPHRRRRPKRAGVSAADRRRWAGPMAVAAGALVVAGVGFGSLLTHAGDSASDTASTAGGAPAAPENAPMLDESAAGPGARRPGALAALPADAQISASDVDYQPGSLAAGTASAAGTTSEKRAPASAEDRVFSQRTSAALQRLTDRTALAGCLEDIARENGSGVTVETVDYARYLGDPALVVTFRADNGTWVWVAGPDCGTPDAAAATLNRVKVG